MSDNYKKKSAGSVDDVLNSSLSKLVAARPNMESSPTKQKRLSASKPAAAAMPLYPSIPDSEEESEEFDFKKIAATPYSTNEHDFDKKMKAAPSAPGLGGSYSGSGNGLNHSSYNQGDYSSNNNNNNSSYNRGDYSPVAKMPVTAPQDDYEDRMAKKMAANPGGAAAKKPPPSYAAAPRKMTPEEKIQEKIRQEDALRNQGGSTPGASFLARPDRMEDKIIHKLQKEGGYNTGTTTPGVQRVAPPNPGPAAAVQAVQTAQPQEQVNAARRASLKSANGEEPTSLLTYGAIGVAVVVAVVIIVVLVVVLGGGGDDGGDGDGAAATPEVQALTPNEEYLLGYLPEETRQAVDLATSPQAKAFSWMTSDTFALADQNYSEDTIHQKFAMATFYYATAGQSWKENDQWLDETVHECNWFSSMKNDKLPCGVPVDDFSREYVGMKNLQLADNGLSGTLPPQIGWLTTLEIMDLAENNLQGPIPSELGLMTDLNELGMDGNALTGTIPAQLGQCTNLEFLYLEQNLLVGNVPASLANAPLQYLRLSGNDMAGIIPAEACPDRSLSIDCAKGSFCGCTCSC